MLKNSIYSKKLCAMAVDEVQGSGKSLHLFKTIYNLENNTNSGDKHCIPTHFYKT